MSRVRRSCEFDICCRRTYNFSKYLEIIYNSNWILYFQIQNVQFITGNMRLLCKWHIIATDLISILTYNWLEDEQENVLWPPYISIPTDAYNFREMNGGIYLCSRIHVLLSLVSGFLSDKLVRVVFFLINPWFTLMSLFRTWCKYTCLNHALLPQKKLLQNSIWYWPNGWFVKLFQIFKHWKIRQKRQFSDTFPTNSCRQSKF